MAIGENVITIIIKNVKFNLIKKYYTLTEQTYISVSVNYVKELLLWN